MGTIQGGSLGNWKLAVGFGRKTSSEIHLLCEAKEKIEDLQYIAFGHPEEVTKAFFASCFWFVFFLFDSFCSKKISTLERDQPWKTSSCNVQRIYHLFGKCTAHRALLSFSMLFSFPVQSIPSDDSWEDPGWLQGGQLVGLGSLEAVSLPEMASEALSWPVGTVWLCVLDEKGW